MAASSQPATALRTHQVDLIPGDHRREPCKRSGAEKCVLGAAGGAGAEAQKGLGGRLRAFLRGRSVRPDAIQLKGITPELVQEAAATTEGFSGRELAKLVASMQVRRSFTSDNKALLSTIA